jgi:adenosylhomocysteine nucleosidase
VIALLAALEAEAAGVAAALAAEGPVRSERRCGRPLTYGTLAGRPVVLAVTGIGKAAAAMTAALVVEAADAVLVVGTAGGLGAGVRPGDLVVATAVLQHDLDARPLFERWRQPELGFSRFPADPTVAAALVAAAEESAAGANRGAALGLPQPVCHRGLVVSGDTFVGSADLARRLRADLPDALAVDMESAAVGQVCAAAGTPFGVVRAVSDRADGDASVDFTRFLDTVAGPLGRDLAVQALRRLP